MDKYIIFLYIKCESCEKVQVSFRLLFISLYCNRPTTSTTDTTLTATKTSTSNDNKNKYLYECVYRNR